jgi:hypothetical protein
MSVPVPLERLRAAIDERDRVAYVLTVSDDDRPHAVLGLLRWDGDALATDVGRRTAANAAARPAISLLFPARTRDDYSLIVDGSAVVSSDGERRGLVVVPTKAVLHRPSPAPDPAASCDADCVPLLSTPTRPRD